MKLKIAVVLALLVSVVVGCVASNGKSTWKMTTTDRDGKVIQVCEVEAPESNIPRDQYDVVIKDGKVSWWVKANNPGSLRTKAMGELGVYTENPVGFFCVKFEKSVEGKTNEVIGQNNIVVEGVTKDTKIAVGEKGTAKINPMLIIGVGCETPTTKVPGNWPLVALNVDPIKLDTSDKTTKVILIPAPTFTVEMPEIDINESGGTKFYYKVIAKNNEAVAVSIKIRTTWTVDSGEKLLPSEIVFNLAGGEKRTIDGAPVRTKKPFHSVSGEAKLISKTYVK